MPWRRRRNTEHVPRPPAGFPVVSSAADAATGAAANALLRDFDSALAEHWNTQRRALVVDMYGGLDPATMRSQLAEGLAEAGGDGSTSPAHYTQRELPTKPAEAMPMDKYLASIAKVQPRRYVPAGDGFHCLNRATLSLDVDMPVSGLEGYLSTWSGYNTLLKDRGIQRGAEGDPLQQLAADLQAVAAELPRYGDSEEPALTVSWPCVLMLAKKLHPTSW